MAKNKIKRRRRSARRTAAADVCHGSCYRHGPKTSGMPDWLAHTVANCIVQDWCGTLPETRKAELERMQYFNLSNQVHAAVCYVSKVYGRKPTTDLTVFECEELVAKVSGWVRDDYRTGGACALPFDDTQCAPPASGV